MDGGDGSSDAFDNSFPVRCTVEIVHEDIQVSVAVKLYRGKQDLNCYPGF